MDATCSLHFLPRADRKRTRRRDCDQSTGIEKGAVAHQALRESMMNWAASTASPLLLGAMIFADREAKSGQVAGVLAAAARAGSGVSLATVRRRRVIRSVSPRSSDRWRFLELSLSQRRHGSKNAGHTDSGNEESGQLSYAARQRTANSRRTSSCSWGRWTISSKAKRKSCWLSIRRRRGGSLAPLASLPTYHAFWLKRL